MILLKISFIYVQVTHDYRLFFVMKGNTMCCSWFSLCKPYFRGRPHQTTKLCLKPTSQGHQPRKTDFRNSMWARSSLCCGMLYYSWIVSKLSILSHCRINPENCYISSGDSESVTLQKNIICMLCLKSRMNKRSTIENHFVFRFRVSRFTCN